MRTSEAVAILSKNIDGLKLNHTFNTNQNNPNIQATITISGLQSFKNSVNNIESTGLLHEQIEAIKKTVLFQTGSDNITINHKEANEILTKIDLLHIISRQVLIALSENNEQELENSINIKLPKSIKNFHDLEKFSHDINIVFSQTITDEEIGGNVEIIGVENGSIWLQVSLATSAAVFLVGSLAWAAMVIYKKRQEGNLLAQQVRSLGIKNDSVEEIQQAQKSLLKNLIDTEANHINSENYEIENPERIARIKHSIELLSQLIEKGTEIYPSLVAPENVSNLFPDPKNILGISSKIRQIENQ